MRRSLRGWWPYDDGCFTAVLGAAVVAVLGVLMGVLS